MPVSSAAAGELDMLRRHREELRVELNQSLLNGRRDGRQKQNEREKRMLAELRQLNTRVQHTEAELKRSGVPSFGQPGRHGAAVSTAGQLAPLAFADEELRRLQVAAMRGETCRIEMRDFSTADPLLPATRFPYPIAAIHESRLLDRLPGYAIDTPAITFIRHVSTTGAPAVTDEGGLKPELIFNTDALTATAVKLAANNGLS
jgi:hypothetical protein